jgi:uncharacterized membrane protein YqjE
MFITIITKKKQGCLALSINSLSKTNIEVRIMKTERFKRTKQFIGLLLPIKAVSASVEQVRDIVSDAQPRVTGFFSEIERRKKSQRNPELIAKMKASRSAMLEMWGVNESEIDRVLLGLWVEAGLFCLFAALGIVGVIFNPDSIYHWIAALMTAPVCLLVAAGRLWRAECISSGQFVLFKDWFFSR